MKKFPSGENQKKVGLYFFQFFHAIIAVFLDQNSIQVIGVRVIKNNTRKKQKYHGEYHLVFFCIFRFSLDIFVIPYHIDHRSDAIKQNRTSNPGREPEEELHPHRAA